jgi:hypothetical protein
MKEVIGSFSHFFFKDDFQVKKTNLKGALDLKVLVEGNEESIGKENFVKSFDLRRSSFGRNPTILIFSSLTQPNIHKTEHWKKKIENLPLNYAPI